MMRDIGAPDLLTALFYYDVLGPDSWIYMAAAAALDLAAARSSSLIHYCIPA